MNVVYYSSDSFAEVCGVSMYSLMENNVDAADITVYIVEDCVSEKNKDRLRAIAETFGREVVFIRMPSQEEVYPGVSINLGRTYARMAIGEILPDSVERVLSLDCDTLVLDTISELYDTNFDGDQFVAGVLDCVGEAIQDRVLQAPRDILYCNAGMFLIDLKKWRSRNVGAELLDLVLSKDRDNQPMYFLEQDLMNLVFDGHLKLAHPRYNMLTSIYCFDYDEVTRMKRPVVYYTEEEISEAKKRPAIVHATTCFYVRRRMYMAGSDHPFGECYEQYRLKTGWAEDDRIADTRKPGKKAYSAFWHMMPRGAAVKLASLLINRVRPRYAELTNRAKISTVATQS